MQQPNKKITLLAAAITATLGISTAQASGFRIPEVSILGLGTSNALVANTDELGALPYNPANMAFHDTNGLVAGVTYIGYDLTKDGIDSTGEDSFFVPNLYAMAPGYGDWSFGLGINAPFGLETNRADGTFPTLGPAAPALRKCRRVQKRLSLFMASESPMSRKVDIVPDARISRSYGRRERAIRIRRIVYESSRPG